MSKARKQKPHEAQSRQNGSELISEFQEENFFFIAGYTSGGVPYGITWEEERRMEEAEAENVDASEADELLPFD